MQRIRMAMIGGCPGRFICDAHHMAWRLDGLIELQAGAFSRDPARNLAAGERLCIDPTRVYDDWQELIACEAKRPAEERIELIASVTPNQLHAPVALAALRAGFPVISDKPLCFSLAEARELVATVAECGLPFALTHNYSGYPLVKEMRELIATGRMGRVFKAVVEYPQGGVGQTVASGDAERIAKAVEPGHRTDSSGCFSDIGTHAAQLLEYVTGERIERVCADCSTMVPGRQLDDDANVLLRLSGGGKGLLFASQISVGEENPLSLRLWCERGGLEWRQQEPNSLIVKWADKPMELRRAGRYFAEELPAAKAATRLPAGHPEGYVEAFATIYARMARQLMARRSGAMVDNQDADIPGVADGFRGMAITQAVIDSAAAESVWTEVPQS